MVDFVCYLNLAISRRCAQMSTYCINFNVLFMINGNYLGALQGKRTKRIGLETGTLVNFGANGMEYKHFAPVISPQITQIDAE